MPVFEYRARADSGVDRFGTAFASDEDGLYNILRQQDLFLLSAKQCNPGPIRAETFRLSRKELLGFTIHMATFLEAGIALMEALRSLTRENPNTRYHAFVEDLITRISAGSAFSEALGQYPSVPHAGQGCEPSQHGSHGDRYVEIRLR